MLLGQRKAYLEGTVFLPEQKNNWVSVIFKFKSIFNFSKQIKKQKEKRQLRSCKTRGEKIIHFDFTSFSYLLSLYLLDNILRGNI